ncbi:MAG: hypothetical protein DLM55_04890 [Acidimicrobiales bacterium]|nr:MAG: hypothetical protein DLM55_04890 [Acidimicrobiales bacterium]
MRPAIQLALYPLIASRFETGHRGRSPMLRSGYTDTFATEKRWTTTIMTHEMNAEQRSSASEGATRYHRVVARVGA